MKSIVVRVGIVAAVLAIAATAAGMAMHKPYLGLFVVLGFALAASNLAYVKKLQRNVGAFVLVTLARLALLTIVVLGIGFVFSMWPAIVTAFAIAIAELIIGSMYAARYLV
ncbi:MAG: hypothetical protein ACP5OR_02470 [Candidatus Dormibacteria bacterium]